MLLQQAQQLLKYPPSPTHQGLQHWRRAMQPVVVSSARRQDLWEAGGVAIEVVAVEGMVVVAVEGMVVVAVEGMELCPPGRSQNAYHMGVSARLIIPPPAEPY